MPLTEMLTLVSFSTYYDKHDIFNLSLTLGGIIRVYHMKQTGWVHIDNNDCSELHYKYQAEKEALENKV